MVKKIIQQYPIVEGGWKVEETFTNAPSHTCRFSRNSDEPVIYCLNKKREIAYRVPSKQNLTAENISEQSGGDRGKDIRQGIMVVQGIILY
jgi:hypothetical protein